MLQLIRHKLPAKRVPVNPQQIRRARLIPVYAVQHALNKALLELPDGLIEQDAAFYHLAYKTFQLILHVATLQKRRHISRGRTSNCMKTKPKTKRDAVAPASTSSCASPHAKSRALLQLAPGQNPICLAILLAGHRHNLRG